MAAIVALLIATKRLGAHPRRRVKARIEETARDLGAGATGYGADR